MNRLEEPTRVTPVQLVVHVDESVVVLLRRFVFVQLRDESTSQRIAIAGQVVINEEIDYLQNGTC